MRRKIILDLINDNPGIGFNEIVKGTNLSNGVVSHYILQLMKENKISRYGEGRSKYFDSKTSEKDMKLISFFRNKTNLKIINLLVDMEKSLKTGEIASSLGKSNSTISVSLKNMQNMNLIKREILNQNSKLTSDIGYQVLDKNFLRKLFSRYSLS